MGTSKSGTGSPSAACRVTFITFYKWLCVRVDISGDHFLLSVWLFSKAKGLVWIEGSLLFTLPLHLHP